MYELNSQKKIINEIRYRIQVALPKKNTAKIKEKIKFKPKSNPICRAPRRPQSRTYPPLGRTRESCRENIYLYEEVNGAFFAYTNSIKKTWES